METHCELISNKIRVSTLTACYQRFITPRTNVLEFCIVNRFIKESYYFKLYYILENV